MACGQSARQRHRGAAWPSECSRSHQLVGRVENHYRVDSYLVFNSPLDQSGVSITNEQIAKWFKICTVDSFYETWEREIRAHPFTLSEGDLYFLSERCLKLKEVSWKNFEVELDTPEAVANALSKFPQLSGYEHLNLAMIEREFRSRLTEMEFTTLIGGLVNRRPSGR